MYFVLFHRKIYKCIESLCVVPMVEPEAELVHVTLHILDRDVVEDAVNAPLEQCPKALYAVGMDAVAEGVRYGVVYLQAHKVLAPVKNVVAGVFVRHYGGVRLTDPFEHGEQLLPAQPLALIVVVRHHRVDLARVALLHADYGRLGCPAPPLRLALVVPVIPVMIVLLAGLAAHIGLVNLHNRLESLLVLLVLNRGADLVQHPPRGLIGAHTKFPLQLHCGHALAGHVHEVDCIQPHPQVEVRVLEYRPFQCRELGLAVVAIEETAVVFLMIDLVDASTFRTHIPVLVFRRHDEVNRGVLARESLCKLKISHYLRFVN